MSTVLNVLKQIMDYLVNTILIPVVLAAIPVLLIRGKDSLRALVTSFINKHKNDSMSMLAGIISTAMNTLNTAVDSAVASNMTFAEKYKAAAADGKLTEAEQLSLKALAKKLVYDTIPPSIKSGNVLDAMGGQDALDKLISGMIEKALIDVKSKTPPTAGTILTAGSLVGSTQDTTTTDTTTTDTATTDTATTDTAPANLSTVE